MASSDPSCNSKKDSSDDVGNSPTDLKSGLIYPPKWQSRAKLAGTVLGSFIILLPFLLMSMSSFFDHQITWIVNDDFTPNWGQGFVNGGIDMDIWSFEYGDGEQSPGLMECAVFQSLPCMHKSQHMQKGNSA
jgi:hypothetical protein